MGPEAQAAAVVKAYAMGLTEGVACIEWFEGMDGDSGPMGLLQADGTPRPSYTAMAQMIRQLGPHPVSLGWVLFDHRDYGFLFQGAKNTVLITCCGKERQAHRFRRDRVTDRSADRNDHSGQPMRADDYPRHRHRHPHQPGDAGPVRTRSVLFHGEATTAGPIRLDQLR